MKKITPEQIRFLKTLVKYYKTYSLFSKKIYMLIKDVPNAKKGTIVFKLDRDWAIEDFWSTKYNTDTYEKSSQNGDQIFFLTSTVNPFGNKCPYNPKDYPEYFEVFDFESNLKNIEISIEIQTDITDGLISKVKSAIQKGFDLNGLRIDDSNTIIVKIS